MLLGLSRAAAGGRSPSSTHATSPRIPSEASQALREPPPSASLHRIWNPQAQASLLAGLLRPSIPAPRLTLERFTLHQVEVVRLAEHSGLQAAHKSLQVAIVHIEVKLREERHGDGGGGGGGRGGGTGEPRAAGTQRKLQDQLTRRSQRTVKYVRWRTRESRDLSGVGL